jgi:hypothetical protein
MGEALHSIFSTFTSWPHDSNISGQGPTSHVHYSLLSTDNSLRERHFSVINTSLNVPVLGVLALRSLLIIWASGEEIQIFEITIIKEE